MFQFMRGFWGHLLLCGVACSFVYLPMVTAPFERHDDYLLDHIRMPADPRSDSGWYGRTVGMGRIINAEITYNILQPIYLKHPTIQTLIIFRCINLLFIIIGFALFSYWMSSVLLLNRWAAAAISVMIVLFPGIQFMVGQSLALNSSVSIAFAFLALLVLNDGEIKGRFLDNLRSRRVYLSIFLLYLVSNDYQTNTVLFLLGGVALIFLGSQMSWPKKRAILLRHLFIFVAALFLNMLVFKCLIKPLYLHFYPQPWFDGLAIEHNIAHLWANLKASLYRPRALNLWFLSDRAEQPGIYFVYFVCVTAVVFAASSLFKICKEKAFKGTGLKVIQFVLIAACFYLGIQSPHILYGTVYYFRVLYLYSAVFLLMCLGAVYFWCAVIFRERAGKVFQTLVCALCFGAAVLAQYNSNKYIVHVAMAEIDFLESSLQPLLNGQASQAVIQRPIGNLDIGGDEHGMLTACFDNDYGLQGMVRRIYKRNGKDSSQLEFVKAPYPRYVAVVDHNLEKRGITRKIFVDMDVIYKILYETYQ